MIRPSRKYILLSLSYILTPPLAVTLMGVWAYNRSVDTQASFIADIFAFVVGASFLAAFLGWVKFLRPPSGPSDGKRAGLLTVCLCYFFCAAPIAVAAGSWDGLVGIASAYCSLLFFGQIATFWITYPLGAVWGRWIAKQML